MAEIESMNQTVVHVRIESEAPYAKTIIEDSLRQLMEALDYTGMYQGKVEVVSPSGEGLYGWAFGQEEVYDSAEFARGMTAAMQWDGVSSIEEYLNGTTDFRRGWDAYLSGGEDER